MRSLLRTFSIIALVSGVGSLSAEPVSVTIKQLASQALKEQHVAGRSARLNQMRGLERLKERLVRESRLKDGVAVEEAIERQKEENLREDLLISVVGTWQFTTTEKVFYIFADGTSADEHGDIGTAEITSAKDRTIRVGTRGGHIYRITEDGKLSVKGVRGATKHPARRLR